MQRWAMRNAVLHTSSSGLLCEEISQSQAILWGIFAVCSPLSSPSMAELSWLYGGWPEPTNCVLLMAKSIGHDARKSNNNRRVQPLIAVPMGQVDRCTSGTLSRVLQHNSSGHSKPSSARTLEIYATHNFGWWASASVQKMDQVRPGGLTRREVQFKGSWRNSADRSSCDLWSLGRRHGFCGLTTLVLRTFDSLVLASQLKVWNKAFVKLLCTESVIWEGYRI